MLQSPYFRSVQQWCKAKRKHPTACQRVNRQRKRKVQLSDSASFRQLVYYCWLWHSIQCQLVVAEEHAISAPYTCSIDITHQPAQHSVMCSLKVSVVCSLCMGLQLDACRRQCLVRTRQVVYRESCLGASPGHAKFLRLMLL